MREYTPENITSLADNEIFVFDSNTAGRHGLGAAYTAKIRFGAKDGVAQGLQGQSYAIITKDLRVGLRSIDLSYIGKQIQDLMLFAKAHPELRFLVTKIGVGNAGYTIEEIRGIFEKLEKWIPDNVVLPEEFEVRN